MTIIYTLIKNLPTLAIGLIGVGFIIAFHELGHFLFCKIFGVKTPSFSIGFGPQLLKKKIGETEFCISAIPLGGYVEIAGVQEVNQGSQLEAHRSDHFSFSAKPYYQKLLILSGGILFNILMAYAIMSVLSLIGAPKVSLNSDSVAPIIGRIFPGSAAEKYGLIQGDRILKINDENIESSSDLNRVIKSIPNQEVTLTVERDKKNIQISLVTDSIEQNKEQVGQLGIHFAPEFDAPLPIVQAIKNGFTKTNQMLIKTAQQYKMLFQNKMYKSIGGPIMLISEVANSAKHGLRMFLLLLIIVSLNLAVLNLIRFQY